MTDWIDWLFAAGFAILALMMLGGAVIIARDILLIGSAFVAH